MRRIVPLSSLILVTGSLLVVPSLFASTSVGTGSQEEASDAKIEEVYTMRCVACHGTDGDSQLPEMSFTDGVWRHGSSEEEVAKTIADGVPGTAMMPFKGQLSAEEIDALATYVRKFDPKLGEQGTKKE